MKRLLSFIIGIILFIGLAFHNETMALAESMSMPMGNHSMVMDDCHENGLSDCDSVCCDGNNEGVISSLNVTSQNNKKKFDKINYSFSELSFDNQFIYERNLIGNISPPDIDDIIIIKSYFALTGIIKSNT